MKYQQEITNKSFNRIDNFERQAFIMVMAITVGFLLAVQIIFASTPR